MLLLEAGGADRNPLIHMPAGLAGLVHNRDLNWAYLTEPVSGLLDRQLYWPRGRVLGGSSSINAMCYTRGHARDYDEWALLSDPQWSYANVLPVFRRVEDQARGADAFHGVGGPLSVEDLLHRNTLSDTFVAAGVAAGLPRNPDFNGARQEGVGHYQVTQRSGRRCSAAVAYLRPALRRPNLEVRTRALALRVLFERERAVAVEYADKRGRALARATRAVIVAAGAVASPQLLMRSGVGPAAELETHGIPVVCDRREVGANLQDHLDFCTLYKSTKAVSYDFNRWQELVVALRYWATGSGPGVSNIAEAGAFYRSPLAPDERPDIQLHFVPAQLDDHGRNRLPGHGFTLHACGLRPWSRGRVALRSASALEPPRILPGYLDEPRDLDVLLEGVRLCREIVHTAPFAEFRGAEVFPGDGCISREDIAQMVRRKAETIYHPVGTCRMGNDPESVVDCELRVRGVEGLRVVDASVMPRLVGGNTNAPVIMIAEKAAAAILGVSHQPPPQLEPSTYA